MAQTPPMQPPVPPLSASKVPPSVEHLAVAQQLGNISHVYKQPSKMRSLGIGLGILALSLLLCFGGGWIGQTLNLEGFGAHMVAYSIFFGSLSLVFGAFVFVASALRTKGGNVYLYARGLVVTPKGGPEAYRWDQIVGLRHKVLQPKFRGNSIVVHVYSMRRADGHQAVLSNHISGIGELWAIITREVYAILGPRVQTLYQQGKSISFGPLAISQQGINTDKDRLPWDQVERCTIANGRVIVKKQGQDLRWTDIAADDFTNLPLFERLTQQILAGRR